MQEYRLKEGVFCTNFCISRESNRIVEMDRKLRDGGCKEVEKACKKVVVTKRKRKKDSYRPGMNEVLPHL